MNTSRSPKGTNSQFVKKFAALILITFTFFGTRTFAEGFPNQTATPGNLLNGPVGSQMGRLAVIEYLGGYVITIPEKPSSPAGSDFLVRAWDISDPSNPRVVGTFGETEHPFLAHGTIKRGNEVYIGGYPNDAIRLNADGSLSHAPWSGPDGHWSKGGLMRPWAAKHWWSYDGISGNAWLELDGERTAEWDHLALTGVIGFPTFMGNLLLYASDQSNTGVAAYDISDPHNPKLLDVLNAPKAEGGIGGYWSEIHGHYIVFARRRNGSDPTSFPGIQVVDFSDPSNLQLTCSVDVTDHPLVPSSDRGNPMYVGFQDEYVFSERFKMNIETCEIELVLDELGNNVETSQYARPLGNLVLTGGLDNWRTSANDAGMGIWAHQAQPDNNAPYVAYHIPRSNQTNYPLMAPISLMVPETLKSETIIPGQTLIVTEVGGAEVEVDYVLSHTGMLTVDPLQNLKANTTYEVRLTSGIEDAADNAMEDFSFRFSTGSGVATNGSPVIHDISLSTSGEILIDDLITISVSASDPEGGALQYRFDLGNGYTAWGGSSQISASFPTADSYLVNAQVRDPEGVTALASITVKVTAQVSEPSVSVVSYSSSQLACDQNNQRLWAVNPDNNSVTRISTDILLNELESVSSQDPKNIAIDARGNLWVTAQRSDTIDIYGPNGYKLDSIETDYGSAPYGIVISPNGQTAYVSLYGSGQVARFDTSDRIQTGLLSVGPTPRALALTPDGNRLLVTRFISGENWGEVWDINTSSWTVNRSIRLDKHLADDSLTDGHGIPNYLSAIIINGDGTRAYISAKKDNTDKGLLNGLGQDIDDDNTVRAMVATIDLTSNVELRDARIDIDNADSPSGLALSPSGANLFVAMQGINQVFAFNLDAQSKTPANIAAQFQVGHAPQGMCMDAASSQLFVKNFTDRSVSAIDLTRFLGQGEQNPPISTIVTVANEALSPAVLAGKRAFYNAADDRMSAEGYISCASCHLDGGHDGRTYDFTGRGEGLRNNISLRGREGTRFGNVHWSGNFDEIQDFEHDIRNAFLGEGFTSDAAFANATPLGSPKAGLNETLDNLAAYVSSLDVDSIPRSPHRNKTGGLTNAGNRGKQLFDELDCTSCHSGDGYSDGQRHDVGTLREYSGQRLGGNLDGLKTPSLLGLFDTAPYLHDGSAATVADIFDIVGGTVYQAEDGNGGELVSQANYSFLRAGAAVRLQQNDSLIIEGVDGGSGGTGIIRIRYGSTTQASQLTVTVNGNTSTMSLAALPRVDSTDTSFSESRVNVDLTDGPANTVEIRFNSAGSVLIDDMTVSNSDNIEAANTHRVAKSLSQSELNDLVAYLLQIDKHQAEITTAPEAPTSDNPTDDNTADDNPSESPSSGSSEGSGGGGSADWLLLALLLMLLIQRAVPQNRLKRVLNPRHVK